MSPIDNHLRDTLSRHATDVADDGDRFAAVEQRARTMHRRRVAWASGATAIVLAGGVVGGVAVLDNDRDTVQVPLGNDGSVSPAPPVTPSPSPLSPLTPTPAATAQADGGALAWPAAGSGPTSWVDWASVLASVADQVPAGFAPLGDPHVVGAGDSDGGAAVLFVVPAGDHLIAAAVLRSDPATALGVHDIPDGGDVAYVGAVVPVDSPSGQVDDGLVVGAPTVGQLLLRMPGEADFHPVEQPEDPRWLSVTLGRVTPGDPVAQLQVLDGDGNTAEPMYEGPIGAGVTFPDV